MTIARRRLAALVAFALVGSVLSVLQMTPARAADESYEYTFEFVNGITISGSSDEKNGFVAGAGGTSVDNPTGMTVHLSCSDDFPDGWGEKEGPEQGVDTAWQIATYTIAKIKDGEVDKTCSGAPNPGPPPVPAIDIEKLVNGLDADSPTGPEVNVGESVLIEYIVTNTGDVALFDVEVTDFDLGTVTCPETELDPGESMDCDTATVLVTAPGQVFMEADVMGFAEINGGAPNPLPPDDDKWYSYAFNFVNGMTVTGLSEDNEPFVSEVGGTSVDNPTGTDMHVSCSDEFPGGWGEKAGPEEGVDTAWQIASFYIVKYKDGEVDKTCGDPSGFPTTEKVTDIDPIHYLGVDPGNPAIDIEKFVNGFDADEAPGPEFAEGEELVFEYIVTNTGDVPLNDIEVVDDTLGAVTCPRTSLDPGESMDCDPHQEQAVVGTFFMKATVTAVDGEEVMDMDPVNFTVVPIPVDIDIEKFVNGFDADDAPGPTFQSGDLLVFDYVVTNTGDATLTNIVVTDATLGVVTCPTTSLQPGEAMTCDPHTETAVPGTVFMEAMVIGEGPNGETPDDDDPVNFVVEEPTVVPECKAEIDGTKLTVTIDPAVPGAVRYSVSRKYGNGNGYLWLGIMTDMFMTELPEGTRQIIQVKPIFADGSRGENIICGEVDVEDKKQHPDVDIEKSVNGHDADTAPGPEFNEDSTLTFEYVVTNTGDVALSNIVVTDDTLGAVSCPQTSLEPGESMDCTPHVEYASVGTFSMEATVDAEDDDEQDVSDTDPVNFTVVKYHGEDDN